MHTPESVLLYDTDEIFRNFEIQIDYLIPIRRPDLEIVSQKKSAVL